MQNNRYLKAGLTIGAMCLWLLCGDVSAQRPVRQGLDAAARALDRAESAIRGDQDPRRGMEDDAGVSPLLGVMVAPSTGAGIYVTHVVPNSPADRAGMRERDYILAVDDRPVNSPEQFRETIAGQRPGENVRMTIWRNQRRFDLTARLEGNHTTNFRPSRPEMSPNNSAPPEPPMAEDWSTQADRPWMGIVFGNPDGDQEGALVQRVHPNGPARKAGLQAGDVIMRIDNQQIDDPNAAIVAIERAKPNATLRIVAQRNNLRRTYDVRLADRAEFFRENDPRSFDSGDRPDADERADSQSNPDDKERIPEYVMRMQQQRHLAQQHQRLEELCSELLKEVKELRKEVNELKKNQ